LVYSTEKSLADHRGDVDAETATHIESVLEKAKQTLESEDLAALKAVTEELTQASHKLAEAMYARAAKEQQQANPQDGPQAGSGAGDGGSDTGQPQDKENIVDADFEEVK
jgi:molecular chaperone DnaK